jgi:predicted DNA-binding ribbon-helix-helix protein
VGLRKILGLSHRAGRGVGLVGERGGVRLEKSFWVSLIGRLSDGRKV